MDTEVKFALSIIGIAFFAVSGTLLGSRKDVNGFGVVIIALFTALGGGTLRDVLLDSPVFWVENSAYLVSALTATAVCFLGLRYFPSPNHRYFLIVDAFGIGLFNVVGIEASIAMGHNLIVGLAMGVITAIFGGILRDVLCREMPVFLQDELYALTCLAGGVTYALTLNVGWTNTTCVGCAVAVTAGLRILALVFNWQPASMSRRNLAKKSS